MLICLSATVVGSAIAPPSIAVRGQPAAEATKARRASEGPSTANQDQRKYLGATTCAGPACHGRPDATDKARSQQTEFTTWSTKDKHHEAFAVLANETSLQVARLLKLDKPPQESDRCLNCHSMNVLDEARRGQDFKLTDGVSCDGCHGPASDWLGTHLNEPYADSLKKGMKDIRNPLVRAEMCLSCHLGNRAEGKIVDHKMCAAGHPPLVFELDAYSHRLPPHWRAKSTTDENLPRAQLWAAGQLVALRDATRLLADDAKSTEWPEYSHFDCAACHHDLTDNDWRKPRQPRPLPLFSPNYTVPPGRPTWQASQFHEFSWMFAWLLVGDNETGEAIRQLPVLERWLFHRPFGGDPKTTTQFAEALAAELERMCAKARDLRKPVPPEAAIEQARRLCDSAELLAWRGPDAARQLAYALHALLSQALPADSTAMHTTGQLEKELDDAGSKYDPHEFVRRVQTIRKQLP